MSTFVNPYLFVVGCPRSGTTLLQRMLDAHPLLTVANDTHFITRAAKTVLKRESNPELTPELVDLVLAYRRFRRMGLDEAEVRKAAVDCEQYAEFVSRLYTMRGEKAGKPFSGEKTPDFCRKLPQLHALFPEARIVHIVRDGRNTALSTIDWATEAKGPGKWPIWEQDPFGTCALWWRWQVLQGFQKGSGMPAEVYRQVLYEDLVTQTELELMDLADFLGLRYAHAMTEFHAGKTKSNPRLSAKSAWLPATAGLRDWTTQMGPEDIQVFEGIAGDALSRFGYPLSGLSLSPEAQVRIERLHHWWGRHKISRDLGEYDGR